MLGVGFLFEGQPAVAGLHLHLRQFQRLHPPLLVADEAFCGNGIDPLHAFLMG